MSTPHLLIVCVTILLLAGIVRQAIRPDTTSRLFDGIQPGSQVACYIAGGQQIVRGEVTGVSKDRLCLRDAELVTDGRPAPLGRVKLPSGSPMLVQEVDPPAVRALPKPPAEATGA